MNKTFVIRPEWHACDHGSPEEKAVFASLALYVGETCLTRVEDRRSRSVRESIYVSAYPLATWLLQNWWRLRYEPVSKSPDWYMAHCVAAAGYGFAWPNLTISGDGVMTTLEMVGGAGSLEQIEYLQQGVITMPTSQFEDNALDFLRTVDARLTAQDLGKAGFACALQRLEEELSDEQTIEWRRLEALAGYGPDEAPLPFMETLDEMAHEWGMRNIEELTAAFQKKVDSKLSNLTALKALGVKARFSKDLLVLEKDNGFGYSEAWEPAEVCARSLRSKQDFNGSPVSDQQLCELLSIPPEYIHSSESVHYGMSAGFIDPLSDDHEATLYLDRGRKTSRRFQLARLLGDFQLSNSLHRLLPITAASTYRQKFQRAFARELLLPTEILKDWATERGVRNESMEELATEYDVSPLTVQSAMVNKGLVDRSVMGEF